MSTIKNAKKYCEAVEAKDARNKILALTIPIRENHTALKSLKETGLDLIFEPSFMDDYQYLVREDMIEKIARISQRLHAQNKTLIIRSAWRSFEHQQLLWETKFISFGRMQRTHPEKSLKEIEEMVSHFIAPPRESMHTTGGAIDALIYDAVQDCVMDFGTNTGLEIKLSKQCYPYHPGIGPEAKKNRALLIGLFEDEDFVCDLKEYWHFDYGDVMWAIGKEKEYAIYGPIM
ncbi:M15 family metallopeptidase [Allomuricauda sp. M10]|uniref:M15 family metallopeptidase n=1 Tax=Allomuricauda sp. M10 TaxID=2683292 RepID=UPI001D1828CB|nr:M15 family metallopeptidase [Muricauda sp. M10]